MTLWQEALFSATAFVFCRASPLRADKDVHEKPAPKANTLSGCGNEQALPCVVHLLFSGLAM